MEVVVGGGSVFTVLKRAPSLAHLLLDGGKTTCALQCHRLVLAGWCVAVIQQKSRCDTQETRSCISQCWKANSLCVTHKCRVMEDFSWRVV